ncbi:response regulator [Parabacteroides sp. 52]|uniref:hybrid sensor histidine kinase/response regulator transcription factor n=1 Tax=unclassified Parabacteroides TaxID=2649774 RepID=UPI0013D74D77|nr:MULTISPECIES: two-component regulator propeller domain-containing protein [unclassified Parabacteroides]MDH6535163.1 signal transduction histidine kinase/DNA-binding response OmpR family regulator/ligand-binding sensor domain-containing protein [Parabacteroides sp. PM5-20]NDV56203.1 response regulator [Parabacteroides sp. 52]
MRKIQLIILALLISLSVYPIYFKHIGMADGLSQISVMSIHQDQLGRMWFGTREGISVYDGERMTVYKAWTHENLKDRTNALYGLECDFITSNAEGDVFFRTNGSLTRYDIKEETFHVIPCSWMRTLTSYKGEIWCVVEDSLCVYDPEKDALSFRMNTGLHSINCLQITQEKIWLGTNNGLYVMEAGQEPRLVIPGVDIYRLFESSAKDIWVGCRMGGLYRINKEGKIDYYSKQSSGSKRIVSNQIREFVEDQYGNIWFGTFDGLHCYNPYKDEFTITRQEAIPGGLSHSSIFSLCIDQQGTIWVGTYYGGVNYFNPESDIFSHYTADASRDICLNHPFVGHMIEDKNGDIWICTEGGGLNLLDRETRTFRYFSSGGPNSIAHNNLKSIAYDKEHHRLYLGTHTGGFSRYDIDADRFHNYFLEADPQKRKDAPNNIIQQLTIYENNLYIAARNGLFVMDLETEEFTRLDTRSFLAFTFDSKGYLWIAYSGQLIYMNPQEPKKAKTYYLNDYQIRFRVNCLINYRGTIYFGTLGAGLYRYNEQSDKFTAYTTASGHLLSNYCYNITETKMGNLLITGDRGLTFFHPYQEHSRFLRLNMSLPISSITEGCGVLSCKNNELFIGGSDGLTSFWEDDLDKKEKDYTLYFSNLYIHTNRVYAGDETKVLPKALPYTRNIDLSYKQNNLIVEFSSTNYVDIQKDKEYEYKLDGFDPDWIPTTQTSLYYTNLNPGHYTLYVREKGLLPYSSRQQGISLGIHIAHPWYNTFWAWLFYLATTVTIAAFILRTHNTRRELALSLQKEKEDKERSEELNQAKLRFFTNISHEFRTPLTLIISQVELLFQSTNLPPSVYNKIIKISKNAYRMRGLITELMDFRKFEQNYVSLHVSEQNLIPFLKDISLSFHEMAMQQSITLRFTHKQEDIPLWFDAYQLQKVFYNLLSNAFKYTGEKGSIEVAVEESETMVTIKVIDTGIGLSPEDSIKVFNRFYQAENGTQTAASSPGTGIGLALCKLIVDMHHGDITVQSQLGYGTIFNVNLFKGKEHFEEDEKVTILDKPDDPTFINNTPPEVLTEQDYEEMIRTFPEQDKDKRFTVLLVEDNEELLEILKSLFKPLYNILTATNGEEGLHIAQDQKPDLIVSDVMMPVMTGTEMCIRIKNNIDLSHIPVVLLTALNSVEQNIEGLQQGADDYIGKPFHAKTLLVRCNNLIRTHLRLLNKFNKQADFDVNLLASNPLDQHFLDQVSTIIDQHLASSEFDVNMLARELAISRSSLFSKFKALTGTTPNEFVQTHRLKKAAVLLREHPQMQVGEISDQLGFSSAVYFGRCFKAQFGVSPVQFRRNGSHSTSDKEESEGE